jgi:hypothetical protein
MIAQKEIFIPTVDTVPVTNLDANVSFTTDFIDFPMSLKDWSLQTTFADVSFNGATMDILVSNTWNGEYVPYSPSTIAMDMSDYNNWIIYDMIMPVRYMKLVYNAGSTTGYISFVITK